MVLRVDPRLCFSFQDHLNQEKLAGSFALLKIAMNSLQKKSKKFYISMTRSLSEKIRPVHQFYPVYSGITQSGNIERRKSIFNSP